MQEIDMFNQKKVNYDNNALIHKNTQGVFDLDKLKAKYSTPSLFGGQSRLSTQPRVIGDKSIEMNIRSNLDMKTPNYTL